jgi:hypothetical protein
MSRGSAGKQPSLWKTTEEPVFLSQRFKRNFNRTTNSGKLKPLRKKNASLDEANTSTSDVGGNTQPEESSARHSITVKIAIEPEKHTKETTHQEDEDETSAYVPHLYSPFPLGAHSSFSPTSIQKHKLSSLPRYLRAKYSAYEAPPPVYIYPFIILRNSLRKLGSQRPEHINSFNPNPHKRNELQSRQFQD